MNVEPGKLMFSECDLAVSLRLVKKKHTLSLQWREPTDADLTRMGLVKLSRVEELIAAAIVKLKQPDLIQAIKESEPASQIEFGDTVRVVRATPNKAGEFFDSWERCIGLTGIWKPTEDENWDGQIECVLYMLSDLELINKAEKPKEKIEFGDYVTNGISKCIWREPLESMKDKYDGRIDDGLPPDQQQHAVFNLIYKAEKPASHVWEVGQYALCPDSRVRRVVHINSRAFLNFHDETGEYISLCTHVPEPPMPELPLGFILNETGWINITWIDKEFFALPLESWIAAAQAQDKIEEENKSTVAKALPYFLALRDWRKLTGRVV